MLDPRTAASVLNEPFVEPPPEATAAFPRRLPIRFGRGWLRVSVLAFPLAAVAALSAPASGAPGPNGKPARADAGAKRTENGAASPGSNLLTNGSFADQTHGWTLGRGPGEARAALEWMPLQGPPEAPEGVSRVTVSAMGSQPWHVQFFQSGLTLKEGEPYTLSFWSRADRNRPLRVAANVTGGDGHGVGLTADRLSLTRDWRKFNLVFTADQTLENRCRVTFVLGDALGSVDLAGVSLRQGMSGKPSGPNLLRNADFRAERAEWKLETGAGNSSAELEWREDVDEVPTGKIARFRVQQLGTERWHVQFIQSGLDFLEGEPYVLTFWARADVPRPLSFNTILDMPDWHAVGLAARVQLTPEWKPYRLAFTANGTVAGHSRLSLILGETLGEVEVHSLDLRHHPVEARNGGVHPLIGSWMTRSGGAEHTTFTFNADGTGSLKTGVGAAPASAAPQKPALHPFLWYVAGKDIVLAGRRHTWMVAPEGEQERLILRASGGRTYLLYRSRKPR